MNIEIPSHRDIEELVKKSVQQVIEKTVPEILSGELREDWISTAELLDRTGWSRSTLQNIKKELPHAQAARGGTIHWPWRRICKEYFEANLVEPMDD